MRAKALAVITTDRFEGKCKQNLLPQDVFQEQMLALIIADLGFGYGNRKFFPSCVSAQGAIQQVELARHLLYHRFQAAGDGYLNPGRQPSIESYIPYYLMFAVPFLDYLSAPAGVECLHLPQLFSQIEHTRGYFLLEINGTQLQFVNFDEHQTPSPRPHPVPRRPAEAGSEEQVLQEAKIKNKGHGKGCQGRPSGRNAAAGLFCAVVLSDFRIQPQHQGTVG